MSVGIRHGYSYYRYIFQCTVWSLVSFVLCYIVHSFQIYFTIFPSRLFCNLMAVYISFRYCNYSHQPNVNTATSQRKLCKREKKLVSKHLNPRSKSNGGSYSRSIPRKIRANPFGIVWILNFDFCVAHPRDHSFAHRYPADIRDKHSFNFTIKKENYYYSNRYTVHGEK